MRNKKSYYFPSLILIVLFAINFGCSIKKKEKEKPKYDIIAQKTFGITKIIYCWVGDTADTKLKNLGENLCDDKKITYIFFYLDRRNSIIDIEKCNDMYDAIPKDGYNAQYSSSNGLIKF